MARAFGAILFYGAANITIPGAQTGVAAGTANWVRNAAADFSINNTAGAATFNLFVQLADVKRPFITGPFQPGQGTILTGSEFQNAFGNAAGGPSNPFSGGSSFSQTPAFPWGISIVDAFAVYSLAVANATTISLTLTRQVYAEGVATAAAQLLTSATLAVTTTASPTTCHVQKVAQAQPITFESTDFSDLILELQLVVPATTTFRVYGMGFHAIVEYGG